ncbi:MAG: hypothetical protein FD133_1886, partial [Erysipelotrichaceae bacterium]
HEFMMNYVEALLKECGASENEFARKLKHI